MPLNRFWSSVWSVALYLLGLSFLVDVVVTIATFFGLMPEALAKLVALPVGTLAVIVGTFVYADWRWGWTAEHMGLHRRPGAIVGGLGGGIVLGGIAAVLVQLVAGWSSGAGLTLQTVAFSTPLLIGLVMALLTSFVVELVFRAAAISRYQADLSQREILLAATLTPIAWSVIQALLNLGGLSTGIRTVWEMAMSVALALLFIRFDSAWLTTGIRFGMGATFLLLGMDPRELDQGGLAVWGTVAAVLLALEWFRQQGQPKRVQPSRGRVVRGRTIRGPWGPH